MPGSTFEFKYQLSNNNSYKDLFRVFNQLIPCNCIRSFQTQLHYQKYTAIVPVNFRQHRFLLMLIQSSYFCQVFKRVQMQVDVHKLNRVQHITKLDINVRLRSSNHRIKLNITAAACSHQVLFWPE